MNEASLDSFRPLDPSVQSFEAIPPPSQTCELHIMRCGSLTVPGFHFIHGLNQDLLTPAYAFLIVHEGKHYVYDLGLRKDTSSFAERARYLAQAWKADVPVGPEDILPGAGMSLESIEEIILSHLHFDHIGDLSQLPNTTPLVFGPHSDASKVEDADKLATALQVDKVVVANRKVIHLTERQDWKMVGSLRGLDYFRDGSLFFLDTPGHCDGHIAALVCIAKDPQPLYHLLTGDAAHVITLLDYDKPARIGVYTARDATVSACKESAPDTLCCFHENLEIAYQSVAKISRMAHEPNINVILAHDTSVEPLLTSMKGPNGLSHLDANNFQVFRDRSTRVY